MRLVSGLELPLSDFLSHAAKGTNHETSSTLTSSTATTATTTKSHSASKKDRKKSKKPRRKDNPTGLPSDEKYRQVPNCYEASEHHGVTPAHSTASLPTSFPSTSTSPTAMNGSTHRKNPSSLSGSGSSDHSDKKPRRHRSQRRQRSSKSVERSDKRSGRYLDDDQPIHVVVSTSDIQSRLSQEDQDFLVTKAMEDEGIQMVRKALSSLNIGS